ncbi:MAG: HetZ-related protein 2 [Prochlorothrix sp.]|nr:HetZ-related protein 2 [Prochlorothrix sp.]
MTVAETLAEQWRSRVAVDCSSQPPETQDSIVQWLLGEDRDWYETLGEDELALATQAMDYRYRILIKRYLHSGPDRAYQQLMRRLGSLFLVRSKVRTWVDQSRDRHRSVMDVLGEVIQEMLQNDRHLRQQMQWISHCSTNSRLRNLLLFTSIEEYCLRPIRNQPLLVYRFVNYLNRVQRGGMTQVPSGELVRMISEDIVPDEEESRISLFDNQALNQYQSEEEWRSLQLQRRMVQQEFEIYLAETLGDVAVDWLRLYLQGETQETIAQHLDLPIKQIYRLREKVNYHAVKVFALKVRPELVEDWLGISLKHHRLGLNPQQWEQFVASLSDQQRDVLTQFQAGATVKSIAQRLGLKTSQVMSEWSKIYLAAQNLRNQDSNAEGDGSSG